MRKLLFQVVIKVYSINSSQAGQLRMLRGAFLSCTTQHRQRPTRTCLHLKSEFMSLPLVVCDPDTFLKPFRFNQEIKILHFIGETKPWTQSFNSATRQVQTPPGYHHLQGFLQSWWNLFCDNVHPALNQEMVSPMTSLS